MTQWLTKPLGDLVEFRGGGTPRRDRPDYWNGDIPWASVKDMQSQSLETTVESITSEGLAHSASNLIPKGTVIVASRVGLGKVAINQKPVAINQDLKALMLRTNDLLPRYLLFFLLSKAEYLADIGVGATVKGLTIADYQKIGIPLAPLAEQERIVGLLDEADEMRRLRNQANHRTADLIPALFNEMFGNLVPDNNRWPVRALGELITTGPQNGLYKHSSFYGRGTPILRIDAFYDGELEDLNLLKRVRLAPEEIDQYRLRENDIVINRVNSPEYLGKSALVSGVLEPTVFESNMMRFSVSTEHLDPHYVISFLQTPAVKQHILANAKHAINQSSINQGDIKSIAVPLPPLSKQQGFAKRIMEIRELETDQATSRRRLDDLFQSMLQGAFNGEL